MSGWTIITMRGKPSNEYERGDFSEDERLSETSRTCPKEYDEPDPWPAHSDIAATADDDERVSRVIANDHVYCYMNMERYAFDEALDFLNDYSEMVKDAVVLGANDTTDTGEARYAERYENGDFHYTDRYSEQHGEYWVGEKALSYMWVEHDIAARDPWHNDREMTDMYLDSGENRL